MFDVFDFGAVGDGETLDTEAVQKAIDACTDAGGGVVYFQKGFYVIGSIFLRDNVTLDLSPEAVILGSTDIADYKGEWGTLIGASGARNIRIVGAGKIDGQGAEFPGDYTNRPRLMYFRDCLNCTIDGVTLRNAASWCVHTVQCDNLRLVNLNVFNRVRQNNDAFDIDSCQDVFVSNCNISSGDDAIALKNTIKRPCRNIVVSNCVISSRWAAFRFGPESLGGFQNITVSNCVIYDTYGCGIKLQVNEGGVMENITFSNIVMENVTGADIPAAGGMGTRAGQAPGIPADWQIARHYDEQHAHQNGGRLPAARGMGTCGATRGAILVYLHHGIGRAQY